ncbi:MAG: tetratricopeptide repeat protein [bacterium]|nr:tetratricopeptide repeat protein [bacterium]
MIFLYLCISTAVQADIIKLKSGSSLSGVIIAQDSTFIQFRTNVGVISLPLSSIVAIEKETPEANYIRAGDLAVEKGELDKATTQYALALQLNPNSTEANEKLKTISAKLDQLKWERLAPYFSDGEKMVQQGRFKEAIAFYQEIYAKNPNPVLMDAARKKLAQTYYQLGKYKLDHISKAEAISAFQKSIEYDRTNPEVYFSLGSVYLTLAQREQDAVEQFTYGLQLQPNNRSALWQRAEAYFRLGKFNESIADYKQVLSQETSDAVKQVLTKQIAAAYLELGRNAVTLNAFDTAVYYFSEALIYRPEFGLAYYELGAIQYKQNNFDSALSMLEKAVQLEPNRTEIHRLLGDTNVKLQRFAEAIKRYQRATELAPSDSAIWTSLADTYRYRGMYSDATKNYYKALELEPNYYPAHYGIAMTFEGMQKYDEAITHYRRATEIRPDEIQAHLALGTILYRQFKQYDLARKEFEIVLQANPQNPIAHFALGQINIAEGYYSNAIGNFQDALKYKPDYAEAYAEMGKAYRYKKNYEFAIEAYSKATAINPNLAEPYQGLGILYHQVYQDYPKALQNYEQFLKVGGRDPQVNSWIEEVKLTLKEKK